MNYNQLLTANRRQLVEYLEGWGFACYARETESELRDVALENHNIEGDGHGPVHKPGGYSTKEQTG
jgi:hypothetical protein